MEITFGNMELNYCRICTNEIAGYYCFADSPGFNIEELIFHGHRLSRKLAGTVLIYKRELLAK